MTHPAYLRDKARAMRAERAMTLDEIAERLALPKTTVWYWIRDLPLKRRTDRQTAAQRRRAHANRERAAAARERSRQRGLAEFDELSRVPGFRDFLCLYIAEGLKRSRHQVMVANSDPAVIAVCDRWLRCLTDKAPTYSVQYHADQDLAELQRYWAGVVGVVPEEIRLQRKSNSNQLTGRTWRSVHGVLSVRVCDTHLRARLQGWMERIQAEWLDSGTPSGRSSAW